MAEVDLLQTVLEGLLSSNRQLLTTMVTKDDIRAYKDEISSLIDDHEGRLTAIERDRLPKWFWPTLAPGLGLLGAFIGWYTEHAGAVAAATAAYRALPPAVTPGLK